MKKSWIILPFLFLLLVTGQGFSQTEKLVNGNMESESGWTIVYLNTPVEATPEGTWNYTTDVPTNGSGGCLFISSTGENNQRQYCIYQEVTLSNNKIYNFDGALKDLTTGLTDSWCEVYLGTEPVAEEDYGTDQILLAKFSTWDACTHASVDGTFLLDGCHNGEFIPDTSGTYYFVFKVGALANNAFDVLIDGLSLTETASKPLPAFSANTPSGFVPLTVQFTDNSKFSESWLWDFGDGETSAEQNPEHTYTNVGKYTVTLIAANTEGDSVLTKTDYISVNEETSLTGGEKLYGTNMESPDFWNITNLNATTIPSASWNYTQDAPTAGEGGNLHITATVNNSTSQYCIWQPVDLLADSAYIFDGAFKDVTGVVNFWCEVYVGTVAPMDGDDYGDDSIKIGQFQTWADCTGNFIDGTFQNDGCDPDGPIEAYRPPADGTYYFVIKVGNTDWEGNTFSFEVMLDEISFKETTPAIIPEANFFADVSSGDAPLTVQFYNQSENAVSYLWNFGDGETSTEEEPSHTFSKGGSFTVSLIAYGEGTSDTLTIEDLVSITSGISINNEQVNLVVYPNPVNQYVKIKVENIDHFNVEILNLIGETVLAQNKVSNNQMISLNEIAKGYYLLRVKCGKEVITKKLIIE